MRRGAVRKILEATGLLIRSAESIPTTSLEDLCKMLELCTEVLTNCSVGSERFLQELKECEGGQRCSGNATLHLVAAEVLVNFAQIDITDKGTVQSTVGRSMLGFQSATSSMFQRKTTLRANFGKSMKRRGQLWHFFTSLKFRLSAKPLIDLGLAERDGILLKRCVRLRCSMVKPVRFCNSVNRDLLLQDSRTSWLGS